jgi:cardiolipin synthase
MKFTIGYSGNPIAVKPMSSRNINLPNTITTMRIFLIPVVIGLILQRNYGICIVFFLFAAISDALDGFIARRFDMRTQLGAVLDPLADKLLIVASVIALFRLGLLPLWLTTAVVGRDFVIAAGAVAWRLGIGRVEMAPIIVSKVNTFFQLVMIFLVLSHAAGMIEITSWFSLLFVLVFITSVVSGVQYVLVWGKKALSAIGNS